MEKQILANVLILLGLNEPTPKLEMQIKAIMQEILAYCYRDVFLESMVLPVSDVIATELNDKNIIDSNNNITSYKEGDMSISFGSTADNIKYGGKLESFKRMRGVFDHV